MADSTAQPPTAMAQAEDTQATTTHAAEPQAAEPQAAAPQAAAQHATHAQLAKLKDSATKEYSLKNYAVAAELYSEATEIQAELHGEMNPSNADLLYAYGRCLYHVAVSKSDVLGAKVAASEEPAKKKPKTKSATKDDQNPADHTVNPVVDANRHDPPANKPFFQITGDENWTDSEDDDDDQEDGDPEAGEDQDEDDFAIAYEILDIARVLLSRRLDSLPQAHEAKPKGKEVPPHQSPEGRHIMERLADTHDLQAEISLENERFSDAVADEKASLDLKLKLFPPENSLVAEAHYKLSLALEFASVTQQTQPAPEDAPPAEAPSTDAPQVDDEMRLDAVRHMEAAIESCKLRVTKERESLASLAPDQVKDKEQSIKDVTEMIGDMEQRLIDLRDPSVNINSAAGGGGASSSDNNNNNPLGGILGSMLGESAANQKARIAEATEKANDLTGLIKKKKKKVDVASATATATASAADPTGITENQSNSSSTSIVRGEKRKKASEQEDNGNSKEEGDEEEEDDGTTAAATKKVKFAAAASSV